MATDSTLKYHAVKSLGLAYSHFRESVPVFKRLGGRLFAKNSRFQPPVEKVGLVSEKLYGRDSEVDTLLAAFDRVALAATRKAALL